MYTYGKFEIVVTNTQALSDSAPLRCKCGMRSKALFRSLLLSASCLFPLCEQQSWPLDKSLLVSRSGSFKSTVKHQNDQSLLDCFIIMKSLPALHLHYAPQHRREGTSIAYDLSSKVSGVWAPVKHLLCRVALLPSSHLGKTHTMVARVKNKTKQNKEVNLFSSLLTFVTTQAQIPE